MSGLTFTVPGVPVAQGSKRVVRGRLIDANAARLKPWRAAVSSAAWDARHDAGLDPFTGPVAVNVIACFSRPKAHYRANGDVKDTAPGAHATKPDIDKVLRAVLDALTDAGTWRDDAQVAHVCVTKRYGPEPGVSVQVEDAAAGGPLLPLEQRDQARSIAVRLEQDGAAALELLEDLRDSLGDDVPLGILGAIRYLEGGEL